jgi:hypothetical protein
MNQGTPDGKPMDTLLGWPRIHHGQRWRCRVRPNCGRFLERPPGRSAAETWHDGSSNRMPSQETTVVQRGRCRRRDCFLRGSPGAHSGRHASLLGLAARCFAGIRRDGAEYALTCRDPSRTPRRTASIGSPSRRPGSIGLSNGSEVHVGEAHCHGRSRVPTDWRAPGWCCRFTSAAWPSNRRIRTSLVFWKGGRVGFGSVALGLRGPGFG